MADVMPKMKYYLFVSIIILVYNTGVFICSCAQNNTFDLGYFVLSEAGSFIPGISIISTAISGITPDINALLLLFTGILTGIQVFILAMVILSLAKNLIWQPDV
jgi:hypothetical protein